MLGLLSHVTSPSLYGTFWGFKRGSSCLPNECLYPVSHQFWFHVHFWFFTVFTAHPCIGCSQQLHRCSWYGGRNVYFVYPSITGTSVSLKAAMSMIQFTFHPHCLSLTKPCSLDSYSLSMKRSLPVKLLYPTPFYSNQCLLYLFFPVMRFSRHGPAQMQTHT